MARYRSLDKFTIASKPVMVSYIHAGVFVPDSSSGMDSYTFGATSNPSLRLAYWDEEAYVSELIVTLEAPSARNAGAKDKKSVDGKTKKRKAENDDAAVIKKVNQHELLRRSDLTNIQVMPSTLQFWTNRHAELHGESSSSAAEQAATAASNTTDNAPPSQTFADPVKHCCYLCSRQFKTAANVNEHERQSQLHQDNLKNSTLVAAGLAKLEKAGVLIVTPKTTSDAVEVSSAENEYRDRAKERRAAFNQPKQPGFKGQGQGKALTASAPAAHAAPQLAPPAAPAISKGASLLGKMGWTAGSGLGATGSGSTSLVAADLYVAGVGLGAEGGKVGDAVEEAARASRGDYREFAERTRDKARERFEKMG